MDGSNKSATLEVYLNLKFAGTAYLTFNREEDLYNFGPEGPRKKPTECHDGVMRCRVHFHYMIYFNSLMAVLTAVQSRDWG